MVANIAQTRPAASAFNASRAFTTTSSRYISLPEANATAASSIPPVSPQGITGKSKHVDKTPTSQKAAKAFKKLTGSTTETYSAYGATEILYKECARQADYTIPQAQSGEEMPKTEDGVDVGIGEGWWHTGTSSSTPSHLDNLTISQN